MKSMILTIPLLLSVATALNVHPQRRGHYHLLQSRQTTDNLQTFAGDLGAAALPITFSGDNARPFLVNGDSFVNFAAAAARTCDVQFNQCANAANSQAISSSVADCQAQKDDCNAAQDSATVTSFDDPAAESSANATAAPSSGAGNATASCDTVKVRHRRAARY